MKNNFLPLVLCFVSLSWSFAQVPQTLSYQGLLTDASGNPLSGAHTVLFNFYTVAAGGTVSFSRGPLNVTTYQGLFTVILGNGQGSNNAGLPNLGSTQYYIGIVADGGTELTPRVALTAVPYAFTASALDAAATLSVTQITGNLPGSQITGSITTATLPTSQLTGTVANAQLASGIDASKITTGTLPASVIPAAAGVPVGTIVAFGGTTLPAGWLLCDGSSLSTTTYSSLFAAIGSNWGSTSANTFRLPDLRGRFLRGRANGAVDNITTVAVDPDAGARSFQFTNGATGDNVGSYQGDDFKSHKHENRILLNWGNWNYGGNNWLVQTNAPGSYPETLSGATGGNETRPKNAYVNYIIKAQ